MGCCFSCFNGEDKNSQSGEPNERTTLLGNPVSNSIGRPLFNQDFSDIVSADLGDEQAALNKILHQTSIDIIDVSAIPTHIEQKDYIDRVKLYQKRLALGQSRRPSNIEKLCSTKERLILKDVPYIEKVLSENPIHYEDMQMVWDAFKDFSVALKRIEVEPQDDLVTKFGVS